MVEIFSTEFISYTEISDAIFVSCQLAIITSCSPLEAYRTATNLPLCAAVSRCRVTRQGSPEGCVHVRCNVLIMV